MTYDRETIGAFVDGELDEISRRRIETALQYDRDLMCLVEAERRLRAALRTRFDPIAEQPVPEILLTTVQGAARIRPLAPKRAPWLPLAVAASAAALVITGLQFRPASNPRFASGPLETALETQLASVQLDGAPIRIGLTFRARDGSWCRTYSQAERSGIACRLRKGWQIRRIENGIEPGGRSEYRQATSAASAVAVQKMAAEPPVDAEEERRLVAAGWSS